MLERTDHVGYTVSDLDRSVEFWSFLLEREPTARKTWDVPYLASIQGYDAVKLEAAFFDLPGELTLELIQYHEPAHSTVDMETYNVGNAHLSFVTADLHRTFERLRGRADLRSAAPVRIEWGPYEGAMRPGSAIPTGSRSSSCSCQKEE